MTDWCVLRTSSANTIRLVESLNASGYGAWTPIEVISKRWPRSKTERDVVTAITPTLAFAPASRLNELAALARSPALNYRVWDAEQRRMVTRGHPHFSLFKDNGEFATVRDRGLDGLRAFEARMRKVWEQRKQDAAEPPQFETGQIVHIDDPAFAGLACIVERANTGKMVRVSFPGWSFPLEISAWSLSLVQLKDVVPEQGRADRIGMAS